MYRKNSDKNSVQQRRITTAQEIRKSARMLTSRLSAYASILRASEVRQ